MAYQRVPNTVEIQVRYTLGTQNVLNTYHAEAPGGYDQSMLDTLAAQIDASPVQSLLADQSINLAYVETYVVGLDVANDISSVVSTGAGAGGNANASLPANVAFVVKRLSGLTGRHARGRVYVGGIPRTFQQSGTPNVNFITTAAAAAYAGHVDGFRTTIEAIGPWNAVIVSRNYAGAKRAEGVTFPWTVTTYDDLIFDARRGRLR